MLDCLSYPIAPLREIAAFSCTPAVQHRALEPLQGYAAIALIETWTGKSWAVDGSTSAAVKRVIDKLLAKDLPDDAEWVAAFNKLNSAPGDEQARLQFNVLNTRYNDLVDRAVGAVTQEIWRHQGSLVDGIKTPVANLGRT